MWHASFLTVSEYLVLECQDLHMLHAYFNTSQGIFTNVSLDKHRFYLYIRWAVSTMVVILEIRYGLVLNWGVLGGQACTSCY